MQCSLEVTNQVPRSEQGCQEACCFDSALFSDLSSELIYFRLTRRRKAATTLVVDFHRKKVGPVLFIKTFCDPVAVDDRFDHRLRVATFGTSIGMTAP